MTGKTAITPATHTAAPARADGLLVEIDALAVLG